MKNNKLNILFVVYTLKKDGVSKSLEIILNNIDKSKYNLELLILANSDFSIDTDIRYRILYSSEFELWNRIIDNKYYSHIEDKYDILISYSCLMSTKYIIDSNVKSKKICFIHGEIQKIHKGYSEEYLNKLYYGIDKIICVSESLQSQFLINLGYEYKNKILVIYNPIDIENIKLLSNQDYLEKIHIESNNCIKMVCVSRLSMEKGIDKIIKIHKRLLDENIITRLEIIGDGELKEYLYELINKLEVADSCTLKGYLENPYPLIKDSDIFVLLSEGEGLSLAIMESMVLEKPIVSTSVCGIVDLLEDKYGMVLNLDEESLYRGVKTMVQDVDLRSEYINKLKKVEEFKFDKSKIIAKIETMFDELTQK